MTPPQLLGGLVKERRWAAVQVVLHNRGASEVTGRLMAHGEVVKPVVYSRELLLPPASRFRVQLYFRPLRSGTLAIQFDSGGEALTTSEMNLPVLPDERSLALVVDERGGRLPFLIPQDMDGNPRIKAAMGHVTPKDLPNRWMGYDAFDVVALHDVTASALSPHQREALLDWVRCGGTVVACVGRFAQQYRDPYFERLLGVKVSGSIVASECPSLIGPDGEEAYLADQNLLVALGEPSDGRVLAAFERRIDCGRAVFVALDGSAAVELSKLNWQPLWTRVITPDGARFQWQTIEAMVPSQLEQLSGYQTPQLRVVWLAVGCFFLAAVPLNYVVFRLLQRLEWAWLVMVALAVGFALVAHSQGLSSRGLAAPRTAISLIRTREQASLARATTFVGVYSAAPGDVTLGLSSHAAAAVPIEEPQARGVLGVEDRAFLVHQAEGMVAEVPGARPASFTWFRFDHLVEIAEPLRIEAPIRAKSLPSDIAGSRPWSPVRFWPASSSRRAGRVSVSGSFRRPYYRGYLTSYNHSDIDAVLRDSTISGDRASAVSRSLTGLRGALMQIASQLPLGTIMGLSLKPVGGFPDQLPASPSAQWLFVAPDSVFRPSPQTFSIQPFLSTRQSRAPVRGRARATPGTGQTVDLHWRWAPEVLWRGHVLCPPTLERRWVRRLRVVLRRIPLSCKRIEVATYDGAARTVQHDAEVQKNSPRQLTVAIRGDQLPKPIGLQQPRIEMEIKLTLDTGLTSRVQSVAIDSVMDFEIPAKRRSSRVRPR